MTAHRNHYVPQWYQKRFITDPKGRLYYLDLTPETYILPTGERITAQLIERNSPKRCFWSPDLYTTQFFGVPNDDIERFLFGAIDNDGANALRAVVDSDLSKVHDLFQRFFEYLDAQKLRTPKGLDWIRSQYPKLSQLDLMDEMQHLQQMHCTMWMEAVREVVSAEDSDVKFIITDHPVTIYHPDFPPDAPGSAYPNDPDIALKGSQTLFPLGPNHCLILTNLEYAQNPNRTDLLEPRTNPRHFGRTITRVDAWIRARHLGPNEVVAINRILKSRARRFIAAAEEGWLFPEAAIQDDWKGSSQVLLPPPNELWHFGGEIVIGYKDGRSDYQDAFGRTSRAHEYLRKETPKTEPATDQPCGCGSGRAYEACCLGVAPEDRPPWDVYSIRERNLMFVNAVEKILGLADGKSWEDVRRQLSDEQVTEIHIAYASLWPRDTDIAQLLPRPDARVFRAVYVGLVDPRTIPASTLGWLKFFDEVVIVNPFMNAAYIKPEYNPIDSPAQYKEQTIKNVALLISLAPFIYAGIVHLVPDPMEFNDSLRDAIWSRARARRDSVRLSAEDLELARELGRDDLKRSLARLPDEDLRRQILRGVPDLKPEDLEGVLQYMRTEQAEDPLALIQPLVVGEKGGQMQQFRGMNFDLAMFFAQLMGAAIYSNQTLTKTDLAAAQNPQAKAQADRSETVERRLELSLEVYSGPQGVMDGRASPTAEAFRGAVRNLWKAALARPLSADLASLTDALGHLEQANADGRRESEEPRAKEKETRRARFTIDGIFVIPPNGYGLNAVRRFLITFGRRKRIESVPLAILFGAAAQSAPDNNSSIA